MGLNLRLFKLIIDSLDYEVSKPFLERNVCKLVDFKNDGYQLKGAQNCLRSIKGYAATGILATCRLILLSILLVTTYSQEELDYSLYLKHGDFYGINVNQ
ncbi:hypothetical protein VCRA2121O157_30093 [Vibrio crassostreae]|nr:hypothetical protein VCRA2113O137_10216 [Vibrio crassostreae]CAK2068252.1 hypothetical protein VCRA2113O138_30092 [Vibrio crassostreae]CAK2078003.1 hypothetical protein VCRA2113O140_30216 [Vibrio crassostreae]CAK2712921.1 hypothetical protein VCRA2119O149_10051 [Vibrio crassostreae]CAK2934298.1 hypothetical protein VCRA2113O139_30092 [Vibrio crassostreae]